MFRKFQQWYISESASTTRTVLAGIGCSLGATVYLIPQGIFLDKCIEVFQLYKDGFPVTLPKPLEDKGKEVLEKTSLTAKQKNAIRFFNVHGFDVTHLGSTSTSRGAAIGIPKMFGFRSGKDVERTDIQVNQKAIAWSSQAGEELKQSMLLSDDGQKFSIAREIYSSSYPMLHIHGISTTAVMIAVFQLSHWGNKRFNLLKSPFKIRAVWYSLSCLLGWAIWISLIDMSNVYVDGECDNSAAKLGKDYASGGVEFYKKKMQQNRALRTLMESKGEKYYTAHGNYYTLFRNKSLPLSHRLDNMKKLQEMLETEDLKKELDS